MKKLLSVLMVLVLIFSACSKPEEPIVQPPENGEPSETEEENKFSIEDIDTSEYDDIKDYGFVYVFTGTDQNGEKLFWIVSKDGEFLDDEPFQDYNVFEHFSGHERWIYGIRGDLIYPFCINEETGEIRKNEPQKSKTYELHQNPTHEG